MPVQREYFTTPAPALREGSFLILYKITDWNKRFENHRSRELRRMDWVPLPNEMDSDEYTELIDDPQGASFLGVWLALILLASKCEPRGTLVRSGGRPHDPASISRISRIDLAVCRDAIAKIREVGWLTAEVYENSDVAESRDDLAESRGDLAENRATGKGREGNGTEGNGTERACVLLDDFGKFAEMSHAAELTASETDMDAARFEWNRLDFQQKIDAVRGLSERIAAGEFSDPAFRPLPQNYLKRRIWQRVVREKQAGPGERDRAKRREVLELSKYIGGLKK